MAWSSLRARSVFRHETEKLHGVVSAQIVQRHAEQAQRVTPSQSSENSTRDSAYSSAVTSVGSGRRRWYDRFRKSFPRIVTVTQVQRLESARMRDATLSHRASRDLIGLRRCRHVLLERDRVAIALDGFRLRKDRRIVDAVGVVMNEFPQLNAGQPLNIGQIRLCQIANRADARGDQLFRRGPPDGKQANRPAAARVLRDFVRKSVCTLSGFSKSLAIFASSLLGAIPTLTVKPSSKKIVSLMMCAMATGSDREDPFRSCRRKHSSMETCSTTGA